MFNIHSSMGWRIAVGPWYCQMFSFVLSAIFRFLFWPRKWLVHGGRLEKNPAVVKGKMKFHFYSYFFSFPFCCLTDHFQ
mgnify:CR=1 FL=1